MENKKEPRASTSQKDVTPWTGHHIKRLPGQTDYHVELWET